MTLSPTYNRRISFWGSSTDRVNTKSKVVKRTVAALRPRRGVVDVCAALYGVMRRTPEQLARVMAKIPGPVPFLFFLRNAVDARPRRHVAGGQIRADFALAKLDKTAQVQLSLSPRSEAGSTRVRKLHLTSLPAEVPALNKLYQQYGNQVTFLVVYITEAHPTDVWQRRATRKRRFSSPVRAVKTSARSSRDPACANSGSRFPRCWTIRQLDRECLHRMAGPPYVIDTSAAWPTRAARAIRFSAEQLKTAIQKVVPEH